MNEVTPIFFVVSFAHGNSVWFHLLKLLDTLQQRTYQINIDMSKRDIAILCNFLHFVLPVSSSLKSFSLIGRTEKTTEIHEDMQPQGMSNWHLTRLPQKKLGSSNDEQKIIIH